ncbi:butyrate kinase [Phocaeicola salanitronis]|uniref:butyrate kinase n=1 Tax=Phocaeicola salanitronis TaxID=376805 RepID=UPI00320A2F91
MKILVINPGSTSTKLAVYEEVEPVWKQSVFHPAKELAQFHHINEQYEYRRTHVLDALRRANIPMAFDAVVARGGILKPIPGGVYRIDERMKHDLWHSSMEHASNLAALIADELAKEIGCPAFIADPVVTDELRDVARLSGIPEIPRLSVFHALNSRAVSRRYAASIRRKYEELNLVVAHLGGGISVSAHHHGRVVDVNNALNGEGPFSPERAGTVPARQLVDLCFSGKYTQAEIRKLLNGKGGLLAYLGTTDVQTIVRWAHAGNANHKLVLEAMVYTVAKQIGAMHVALHGQTDAIILTGGIANNAYVISLLREWIEGLARIVVLPGEDEMEALAMNALGVLKGELPLQEYGVNEE